MISLIIMCRSCASIKGLLGLLYETIVPDFYKKKTVLRVITADRRENGYG